MRALINEYRFTSCHNKEKIEIVVLYKCKTSTLFLVLRVNSKEFARESEYAVVCAQQNSDWFVLTSAVVAIAVADSQGVL